MALGKDLAEIREEQGIDINDIQGLTKLSLEIITKIESDSIFNSEIYNEAYKRNFVRSYARALKIKESTIVQALDAMDEGTYDFKIIKETGVNNPTDNFNEEEGKSNLEKDSTPKKALIRTELNYDTKTKIEATKKILMNSEVKEITDFPTASNEVTEPLISTDSKKVNPSVNPPDSKLSTKKTKVSASLSDKENPRPTDKVDNEVDPSDYSEDLSDELKKAPKPKKQPSVKRSASSTKTSDNVNWAQMGKQFSAQQDSKSNVVFITVLAIITMCLLLFSFLYRSTISSWFTDFFDSNSIIAEGITNFNSDNNITADSLLGSNLIDNPTNPNQNPDISETSAMDENQNTSAITLTTEEVALLDSITLRNLAQFPDTLQIVVYAAYDKLEPVRIGSDLRESIYPIWIEKGQAYYFDFNQEITIRGQLRRMLILFNNNVIEAPLERFAGVQENSLQFTRIRLAAAEFEEKQELVLPDGVSEPDSMIYAINF
tara:strand:+ start:640 stop:2106 length:1467 start_codon:yes stop_codon:yes gene_type:complete